MALSEWSMATRNLCDNSRTYELECLLRSGVEVEKHRIGVKAIGTDSATVLIEFADQLQPSTTITNDGVLKRRPPW